MKINLLPWRDDYHSYQQKIIKRFRWTATLSALMMVVVMHGYLLMWQSINIKQIKMLQQQIKRLPAIDPWREDARQKERLQRFMQTLQQQTKVTLQMLDLLQTIPKTPFCLTQLTHEKNHFAIAGEVASASDLTWFLTHSHFENLFSDIKLERLEQKDKHPWLSFNLSGTVYDTSV